MFGYIYISKQLEKLSKENINPTKVRGRKGKKIKKDNHRKPEIWWQK